VLPWVGAVCKEIRQQLVVQEEFYIEKLADRKVRISLSKEKLQGLKRSPYVYEIYALNQDGTKNTRVLYGEFHVVKPVSYLPDLPYCSDVC
jgi:hypothetical protein